MAKGIEWLPADENSANHQRQNQHITPTAPPLHPSEGHNHELPTTPHQYTSAATMAMPDGAANDVVRFLVNGTDTMAIRREHIRQHSAVLYAIVSGGQPPSADGHYRLPEIVELNLFASMLKYFETDTLPAPTSTPTGTGGSSSSNTDDAFRLMEYAKRFECARLMQQCVRNVDSMLTVANVVELFRLLRFHVPGATVEKSRLPLAAMSTGQAFEALMYNVLQFIDHNADVVLQMEESLDVMLNFTDVECILSRDTLIVSSEVVIYNFLGRWSRTMCQKRRWEPTAESRRRILGSLIYLPRYLLMTVGEFELSHTRFELLSDDERKLVADGLTNAGRSAAGLTDEQLAMMTRFRRQRPKYARMPLHLSDRSAPKNYSHKMRKNERKLDDDGTGSWLYWFCGCYAFICD